MQRSRGLRAACLMMLLVGSAGCATESSGILTSGTVRAQITDLGLTFQNADPQEFQVATWVVEDAALHLDGFGDFDFLGARPCVFSDNVILNDDLGRSCAGSGLALESGLLVHGTLRLVVSSMTLRRAEMPVLSPEQDNDGDGIPNRIDNCPLIPNPLQQDLNLDGDGDACEIIDPRTGALSLRDSDGDGWPDGIDNCQLVSNSNQRDAVRGFDFIGDACERFTNVVLPGGRLALTFPVEFTPRTSAFTILSVDFDSRDGVRCDATRTSCRLDPAAVVASVSGG